VQIDIDAAARDVDHMVALKSGSSSRWRGSKYDPDGRGRPTGGRRSWMFSNAGLPKGSNPPSIGCRPPRERLRSMTSAYRLDARDSGATEGGHRPLRDAIGQGWPSTSSITSACPPSECSRP
jgi:hypothetical protein